MAGRVAGQGGGKPAGEAVGTRPFDDDLGDGSDQPYRRLGVDGLKIGAAPDELPGMPAGLLEQDGARPSEAGAVEVRLLGFEQRLQPHQPLCLDRIGDLVGLIGRRRSRPRAVLERIGRGVAHFIHDPQGCLEIFLGLAGETEMKSPLIAISGRTVRILSIIAR